MVCKIGLESECVLKFDASYFRVILRLTYKACLPVDNCQVV